MTRLLLSSLAASLLPSLLPVLAQAPGSIVDGGNTQVSAMMMFVGNEEKVYILDKAEGNAAQVNGHPAWGAVYDINTNQVEVMDVLTNVFCASGMHLPNGSFVTFGGNGAVGPTGAMGSEKNPDGYSALWDQTYQDYDGRKSIRILNPCTGDVATDGPECQWYDNATFISMQKQRWYSAAEPLGDGSIAIIGGFVNGGYINRNFPNTDPETEGGAAEPTYEFFPSKGNATVMQFMIETSGLNAYALTYLMPSGQMFIQANLSTILWDPLTNVETPLPPMPNGVVRVYPASGANAMLPLTPANNWTPTVLFCGGSDMPADAYGDYSFPAINTFYYPASSDCQRITPEPLDGSAPTYEQDDSLLDPRTMGQFIALPDGTLLIVNGGANGTAGYAQQTGETASFDLMPYGESLASAPVFTPAIYNPNAPSGQRWSNAGLSASKIPRLYHSSAILLPNGAVLIAGSNPNVDVNTSTIFPTTYQAEIFYPPYFKEKNRPVPQNVPTNLTYGGAYFDITVPASSYSGSANDAASNTSIWLMRPGFTTHAMNMGQRALQLNNTYTVNSDGSFTLHTSQLPPNPNIFQPGPAFLFVTVQGVPSNGTHVIVGNGQIATQDTADVAPLPPPVQLANVKGTGSPATNSQSSSGNTSATSHTGAIIGGIIAAVAALGVLGAGVGICMRRRRASAASAAGPGFNSAMGSNGTKGMGGMGGPMRERASDSSAFVPLNQGNNSQAWASSASLTAPQTPYKDSGYPSRTGTPSADYDAYADVQQYHHGQGQGQGRTPQRY